jgi:hypothetical protein
MFPFFAATTFCTLPILHEIKKEKTNCFNSYNTDSGSKINIMQSNKLAGALLLPKENLLGCNSWDYSKQDHGNYHNTKYWDF